MEKDNLSPLFYFIIMITKDSQLDFRFPNDAAAIVGSWLRVFKKDYGTMQDTTTLYVYLGTRSIYYLKTNAEPIIQATYVFQSLLGKTI